MKGCENTPCNFVGPCLLRQYFLKNNRHPLTPTEPAEAFNGYGEKCLRRKTIEKQFRRILSQSQTVLQEQNDNKTT